MPNEWQQSNFIRADFSESLKTRRFFFTKNSGPVGRAMPMETLSERRSGWACRCVVYDLDKFIWHHGYGGGGNGGESTIPFNVQLLNGTVCRNDVFS